MVRLDCLFKEKNMVFEHFTTVRLGTCRYPETLSMLLRERGHPVLSVRTGDIVNAAVETDIDLATCMQQDLGIDRDRDPSYVEITAAAQLMGLRLCPAETYLQLLLQHEESLLRLSERYYCSLVTVMSAAIPDQGMSPYLMRFRTYEGRLLMAYHWFHHYKDYRWGQGPFLFVKPRT
jgi:hypothetical protein